MARPRPAHLAAGTTAVAIGSAILRAWTGGRLLPRGEPTPNVVVSLGWLSSIQLIDRAWPGVGGRCEPGGGVAGRWPPEPCSWILPRVGPLGAGTFGGSVGGAGHGASSSRRLEG